MKSINNLNINSISLPLKENVLVPLVDERNFEPPKSKYHK
jgi:hypothetical protein